MNRRGLAAHTGRLDPAAAQLAHAIEIEAAANVPAIGCAASFGHQAQFAQVPHMILEETGRFLHPCNKFRCATTAARLRQHELPAQAVRRLSVSI